MRMSMPGASARPRALVALCLAVALALPLGGCSEKRPNLLEVYPDASRLPRRPVIIIPGFFGSRLMNSRTGEVVWGRFINLLTSRFKLALNPMRAEDQDLLDLPIDSADMMGNRDNLVAYDLFDGLAGRDFYRRIIQTLTQVAGYRVGRLDSPRAEDDCYAFFYDWRRDVAENARLLGEAIGRVRAAHRATGSQVDLIGHSLGGILARYYVRFGGRDVLTGPSGPPAYAGAKDVDTVVLIGVPNEGSIDTLESHNKGLRIGRQLPPEAIFTMPAAYQTLPRPRVGPFIDPSGRKLDIDIYAPKNWEKYEWSAFGRERLERVREKLTAEFGRAEGERRHLLHLEKMRSFLAAALERAHRLNEALDKVGAQPDTVRYFAFGGDCTPTPVRAMIIPRENGTYRTIARFDDLPRDLSTPEIKRLMSEPGDGSVSRSSLLASNGGGGGPGTTTGLRIDYTLFLCETHRNLTENITFQDNLLQFLLYRR